MTTIAVLDPEGADVPSRGEWLRLQRQSRGWSVPEMRRRLRGAARRAGDTLPGDECLGVMIRRWEKDMGGVSERYRMHYCQALGIPLDDFGTALISGPLTAKASPPPAKPPAPVPPVPVPLDADERAELRRLRTQNSVLTARYDVLRQCIAGWARLDTDPAADITDPPGLGGDHPRYLHAPRPDARATLHADDS